MCQNVMVRKMKLLFRKNNRCPVYFSSFHRARDERINIRIITFPERFHPEYTIEASVSEITREIIVADNESRSLSLQPQSYTL